MENISLWKHNRTREFKSDKTFNRWLNVQLLVMGVSNKDHALKRRESLGYVNTRQGLARININQQVRISYNLTSDKISVLPLREEQNDLRCKNVMLSQSNNL